MKKIAGGRWVCDLRPSVWFDGETYILSMSNRSECGVSMNVNARVLDQFSDREAALEAMESCHEWLASDELTRAFIANAEDAIIESWEVFSLIDHDAQDRADAEELAALPTFGMF